MRTVQGARVQPLVRELDSTRRNCDSAQSNKEMKNAVQSDNKHIYFKKLKTKEEVEGVGPLSNPKVTQSCVPVSPTLNTVPQWQHLKAPAPTSICFIFLDSTCK